MKKISYILSIFLVLSSCEILDVKPTQSIDSSTAISNKNGVERAINGAYDALQSSNLYGRNAIIAGDLAADNLNWSGTSLDYGQIQSHDIPSNNVIVEGIWSACYDAINRVNNVLDKLEGISDMTEDEKLEAEAKCLFIRALMHFELLRWYGEIPVKLHATVGLSGIDAPRNSLDEVYQSIISDFTTASVNLPENAPAGYATIDAAKALLARVYLYKYSYSAETSDLQNAYDLSGEVIAGNHSLVSDYNTLFQPETNNESLFEVVFSAQDKNVIAQYFFPRSLTGRYEFAPTDSIISQFAFEDLRDSATIAFDKDSIAYCNKYRDVSAGTDRVYIIRLAEMYTIRAEASLLLGLPSAEALTYINVLRLRSGISEFDDSDNIINLILNECRREFAFEGHRWHDLVRTHQAESVLGISADRLLFPIPLSELETNVNMTPNPSN